MDLQAAYDHLTKRIHESPLGSPQQRDYIARRRHLKHLLDKQDPPPKAA